MAWATIFSITNLIALVAWILLILGPRGPKTAAIILYVGVGLLCLAYAVMFGLLVGGLVDPVRALGASGAGSFTSIEGIRALFMSDGGIVLGWTHYLAFDLFVGQWIAKDADHKGFVRWVQAPVLLATFIAGPIGLFVWLLVREQRARKAALDA
ncbi:MAG: ABA4-like family protein [Sphingomicrobium sp.]